VADTLCPNYPREQGDQMRLQKIAQNVAQPIFCKKILHKFYCGKSSQKIGAFLFVFLQKTT
jgi:hypothetical protein